MEILFVRHGQPDKSGVDARGFIGHGRDLAPLTELGKTQAQKASHDPLLDGAELILTSPYTRAMQTAAILSKNTGLELTVELDLHEFLSDKSYQLKSEAEDVALHEEFNRCRGVYPEGETRKWETVGEIITRTKAVFDAYYVRGYKKIIAVSHGGVIRRYTGVHKLGYCEICRVEYTPDYECFGWV